MASDVRSLHFKPFRTSAILFDGGNHDRVSAFLGTENWREVNGVETLPGFHLYTVDGEVHQYAGKHKRVVIEERSALVDTKADTEENPQYEVHIGHPTISGNRYAIIWLNGHRYEGILEKQRD